MFQSFIFVSARDGKMTIFFGPARNTIFNFRPVWAGLGPRQNLLSLMFYTKTTNTQWRSQRGATGHLPPLGARQALCKSANLIKEARFNET